MHKHKERHLSILLVLCNIHIQFVEECANTDLARTFVVFGLCNIDYVYGTKHQVCGRLHYHSDCAICSSFLIPPAPKICIPITAIK